jgi:hypothetical protein
MNPIMPQVPPRRHRPGAVFLPAGELAGMLQSTAAHQSVFWRSVVVVVWVSVALS